MACSRLEPARVGQNLACHRAYRAAWPVVDNEVLDSSTVQYSGELLRAPQSLVLEHARLAYSQTLLHQRERRG